MRTQSLLPLFLSVVSAAILPRQNTSSSSSSSSSANSAGTTASANTTSTNNGNAPAPAVTIYPLNASEDGVTLYGKRDLTTGVDKYSAIPFAAPPVGDLRWKHPQPPTWNTTTFNATSTIPTCIQAPNSLSGSNASVITEDCLYLNVFTPQGANAQTAYLPVFVWVYGGGFTAGSAQTYDARVMLAAGSRTSRPFIAVVPNYRLGVLGFPYGKEAAENGAGNLGIRDVQLALEWTQQNIWAFGGDPSRVTLAGESAGAIINSLLLLQKDLTSFRSVIIESGGVSVSPIGPIESTWQAPFDHLAQVAGCLPNSTLTSSSNTSTSASGSSNAPAASSSSSSGDVWQCLRGKSAQQLLQAQVATRSLPQYQGFIFAPSIDGDLIPSSPHELYASGEFRAIPQINGNMKDEGTLFTPTSLSGQSAVALVIGVNQPQPVSNQTLAQIYQLYPDDPALGSPFGTGNNTFGFSPEWKRAAAVLGDATFQASRRWMTRQQASIYPDAPVYAYLFNQTTPDAPAYLGVAHGQDVPYVFGLPILGGGNYTQTDAAFSLEILNYWINFIYNQDPNGANATVWPAYNDASTGQEYNMLKLQYGNTTLIQDNYREDQIGFFNQNPDQFALRKRGLSWNMAL